MTSDVRTPSRQPHRPGPPARPDHLVVVLLDSLNRHLLEAYGGTEFETPNIARFATESLRFRAHHVGSLPCMPARHDILVGALDFPWRPWGSIEVWEDAITRALHEAGVTTMLVSDHPHLFETGGENYHTDFTAWQYERGHEGDPWRTAPDPTWVGTPTLPAERAPFPFPYDMSRTWFRAEEDFPGPKTMSAAAAWIRNSAAGHERFFLLVDEFDPHEPFDTPEPYARMYDPDWEGPLCIWPPYVVDALASGALDARKARHIRANYGSKLTMIDAWFGRLLDALDDAGVASTTAVVLCTDHGHFLGEHDVFGKPGAPIYREMGHIPLLVRWPGQAPRDVDALTTSVDIHATIADLFGARAGHRVHGRSLLPLIEGTADSVRELALFGYWGRHVGVTDGHTRYLKGCGPDTGNYPLTVWSNRWSTMPIHAFPHIRLPRPDGRATLRTMPGTEVPVIVQPYEPGDRLPFWAAGGPPTQSYLFDVDRDPAETENRSGEHGAAAWDDALAGALREIGAPEELFDRLGLG
ncbi:MAG TPA: sulfatase [Acidimicrobiales bacterium]|nr:sulfatase [Acidimicrobiales bacterium]